jgi:FtsZ-binding cell division protein ZapB
MSAEEKLEEAIKRHNEQIRTNIEGMQKALDMLEASNRVKPKSKNWQRRYPW